MCERLEIRIIAASSPQAKGRVERNNGVHQDRLVKKLRRQGIQSYEATNEYLEAEYLAEHNQRFAREAARARELSRLGTERSEAERGLPARDGTMDQQRLGGAIPGAFFCNSSRRISAMGRHKARPWSMREKMGR